MILAIHFVNLCSIYLQQFIGSPSEPGQLKQ